MALNFNFPLTGLDGKPLLENGQHLSASKVLAAQLGNGNTGDALKIYHWAVKLYAGDTLELDPSDKKTLRELIENNQFLTILVKAQLLQAFEN